MNLTTLPQIRILKEKKRKGRDNAIGLTLEGSIFAKTGFKAGNKVIIFSKKKGVIIIKRWTKT